MRLCVFVLCVQVMKNECTQRFINRHLCTGLIVFTPNFSMLM